MGSGVLLRVHRSDPPPPPPLQTRDHYKLLEKAACLRSEMS